MNSNKNDFGTGLIKLIFGLPILLIGLLWWTDDNNKHQEHNTGEKLVIAVIVVMFIICAIARG